LTDLVSDLNSLLSCRFQ